MAQGFQVVQCGSCQRFQVVAVTKRPKFACRVCGERNSVRRVYARGDKAREMRAKCQQLNLCRGEREEAVDALRQDLAEQQEREGLEEEEEEEEEEQRDPNVESSGKRGFWDQFREPQARNRAEEDEDEQEEGEGEIFAAAATLRNNELAKVLLCAETPPVPKRRRRL